MRADQLRAIANQMDQEFRQAVGQIDPRVLYFPEPNTLVKLQGDKIEVSFGVGYKEGETMMKPLIEKRSLQENDLVWDNSAGLTTLGDRFGAKLGDKEVNGQVMAYSGGVMTGKGITLEQFSAMFKADQMQATRSKLVARIAENVAYHPAEGGDSKTFQKLLIKLYNPIFPHTAILGAEMGNITAWRGIQQSSVVFNPTSVDLGERFNDLIKYYQNELGYPPAKATEVASKILAMMYKGATAIKDYMRKLFAHTQPA